MYQRYKWGRVTHTLLVAFCACVALSIDACAPNNVTKMPSWEAEFTKNKVNGTFALFDNGQGEFYIYNVARYKDSAYLPASTFKIMNGLVALKTGRVASEKQVFPWDGVVRFYPNGDTATNWNKDLTFADAFKYSAVPVFQQIARSIGKDTMQFWLDSMHYGNKKIGTEIDRFWLNNSLTITSDEQLGFVKRLYFELLPMDKRPQRIMKQLMEQERNANYILSYKTGWGNLPDGKELGWVVGWIEENKHPYFFVLNMEGPKGTDLKAARENILKNILTEQGFFQGKK
jgi:beta-lactamase class D